MILSLRSVGLLVSNRVDAALRLLRRLVCSIGNTSPNANEDFDFVRVRGVFPRTGSLQYRMALF
jgi:hypothetical protein